MTMKFIKNWSAIVRFFVVNPKICLFCCFSKTYVSPETPKEVYFFLVHPVCDDCVIFLDSFDVKNKMIFRNQQEIAFLLLEIPSLFSKFLLYGVLYFRFSFLIFLLCCLLLLTIISIMVPFYTQTTTLSQAIFNVTELHPKYVPRITKKKS